MNFHTFSPLMRNEVKLISRMYIDIIMRQMDRYEKTLIVSDEALDILVDSGYSPKYGARFLKRHIDDNVKIPITMDWNDADHYIAEIIDCEAVIVKDNKELMPMPA